MTAEVVAIAEKASYAGEGPYRARPASDKRDTGVWYVCGPDGVLNILRFPGGAMFTSQRAAEAIAAKWNIP